MVLYLKDPKDSIQKLLDLKNTFQQSSKAVPIKILVTFFTEENNLNIQMEVQKTPNSQSNPEQEE
jgi:hypothetical protein